MGLDEGQVGPQVLSCHQLLGLLDGSDLLLIELVKDVLEGVDVVSVVHNCLDPRPSPGHDQVQGERKVGVAVVPGRAP